MVGGGRRSGIGDCGCRNLSLKRRWMDGSQYLVCKIHQRDVQCAVGSAGRCRFISLSRFVVGEMIFAIVSNCVSA